MSDDQNQGPSTLTCALVGIGGAAAVVGVMCLLAGKKDEKKFAPVWIVQSGMREPETFIANSEAESLKAFEDKALKDGYDLSWKRNIRQVRQVHANTVLNKQEQEAFDEAKSVRRQALESYSNKYKLILLRAAEMNWLRQQLRVAKAELALGEYEFVPESKLKELRKEIANLKNQVSNAEKVFTSFHYPLEKLSLQKDSA
jgi:hypothetical protein